MVDGHGQSQLRVTINLKLVKFKLNQHQHFNLDCLVPTRLKVYSCLIHGKSMTIYDRKGQRPLVRLYKDNFWITALEIETEAELCLVSLIN